MSDPLFVYVFTTKSEINTFTFCTNIFWQICYISILNYLVKETEQEENLREFSEHFASQNAIKRPRQNY